MKNFLKKIKKAANSKNAAKNALKTESELPEELGNEQNKKEYYTQRGQEDSNVYQKDQGIEEGKQYNEEPNKDMETKIDTEQFSLRRLIVQAQKIKENQEKKTLKNSQKKMNVNPNISVVKENKKEQKAYFNFIQTIKKANYSKTDRTKNIMDVDPKVKVTRAIDKIHKLNRIFHNTYRKTNREEETEKQEVNYNANKTDIYDNRLDDQKKGFTGFVLLKQNQGENVFQINLEGTLEEINKIFRMYNIEIDGAPVELIHTKAPANKEPSPFFATLKKKTMETENAKMEEDSSKLKEMQERVQKFKTQLRKAEDEDAHINLPSKRESIKKEEEDYNKNMQEKKRAKTIAFEEKEKDRERSYSRAMDRFKKRYKKDHSVEIRSKKSGKILEMSKQLENVMSKPKDPSEINNISKKEQDNNFEQILENKPVVAKKSKKMVKKFEF